MAEILCPRDGSSYSHTELGCYRNVYSQSYENSILKASGALLWDFLLIHWEKTPFPPRMDPKIEYY